MTIDPQTLAAILAMAVVTYACRTGGYLVFRRFQPPPLLRAILGYVPGTLFTAYVIPAVLAGGRQSVLGAIVTVGAMLATRNYAVAILGGTAACWAVWSFG